MYHIYQASSTFIEGPTITYVKTNILCFCLVPAKNFPGQVEYIKAHACLF